jgi:hypothetical protein
MFVGASGRKATAPTSSRHHLTESFADVDHASANLVRANATHTPPRIEHKTASKMLAARARVVSRALYATRGLSTTARILSNGTPPKPPPPIDDSTSALDYKTSHKVRPPPLPKMDLPRSRSAEEAVTNILYNTPPPSLQPYKK